MRLGLRNADGPAPAGSIALSNLPQGASARLVATDLDPDTRDLLRAMGLTNASTVRVCKPGDPFIIQVRDTRLGLSPAVAARIRVSRDRQPGVGTGS
jgi:Fe2+ transport system protein FeoA